MSESALVSALYLPPAEWFLALKSYKSLHLDPNELWIKQTLRNRTYILGANGIQCLSVPVKHNGGIPVPIKDIRISYSEPWVRVHKGAFFSAYNTSPFFEFFKDEFFAILDRKPEFLFDLNQALLHLIIKKARLNISIEPFDKDKQTTDLKYLGDRNLLISTLQKVPDYAQVFSYKWPFQPYLSVIDLISNTGKING